VKKVFRKSTIAVVGLAAVGALVVAGAGSAGKRAGILVCGLMPDTKTSVRWEQFDKPYLQKAFKAAGVSARVVNAQGDPQKQKTQADQCISDGAKVLIIAPIDSGSASAIEKAASAKGVKSIDYDRQVEGGTAVLYASFNGHTVGVLQGTAVANALKDADGTAVEGDVDRRDAARHLPVVVDRRNALRLRCLLDRRRRPGVQHDHDQDLRARAEALIGLRLLLLRVVVRVGDRVRDLRRLERRDERGLVEVLPAHGRRSVGQKHANVTRRGLLGRAGGCPCYEHRRNHGDAAQEQPCRTKTFLHWLPLLSWDEQTSLRVRELLAPNPVAHLSRSHHSTGRVKGQTPKSPRG
jgi:hypothetical protein